MQWLYRQPPNLTDGKKLQLYFEKIENAFCTTSYLNISEQQIPESFTSNGDFHSNYLWKSGLPGAHFHRNFTSFPLAPVPFQSTSKQTGNTNKQTGNANKQTGNANIQNKLEINTGHLHLIKTTPFCISSIFEFSNKITCTGIWGVGAKRNGQPPPIGPGGGCTGSALKILKTLRKSVQNEERLKFIFRIN